MKTKKTIIMVFMLILITIIGSGCSKTSNESTGDAKTPTDSETYTLKISHSVSTSDFMHKGWVYFKDEIEKKSNGKIKVEIYDSSALTVDRTLCEYVRDNQVQMGSAPTSIISVLVNDKRFLFSEIPFFFEGNDELLYKVTDGESFNVLEKVIEEKLNAKVYGVYSIGNVSAANSKRPIKSLADLNGLKIRTAETSTWMETFKALGANPTPMNFGEIYTGLQQKTVDGVATLTNLIYTSRFYEQANYFVDLGVFQSAHTIMMNKDFYNGLPADLQKMVDETMVDTMAKLRADSVQAGKDAIKSMEAAGVVVSPMTPELKEECKKAVEPAIEKIKGDIGADFMQLVEADLAKK